MHDQTSGPAPDIPARTTLAEDWVTIWQSELAALVLDREAPEMMLRLIDAWAEQTRAVLRAMQASRPSDDAGTGWPGPAGARPIPPPRAAPAAAAPDGRDDLIARLERRVAELERRLDSPTGAGGQAGR